ncbi:MAG TPA: polysaccharide biosynthesis/export family protein [Segetibacter sp.]|jgi:polysaccharide export outer membrane protein
MKNIFQVFVLVFTCGSITACNSEKKLTELVYFNEASDSAVANLVQKTEATIQPGDRLSITVNALNPESAAPYNLGSGSASNTTTGSANSFGYVVEDDGRIRFPQLGRLPVAGRTRIQLINLLTDSLRRYVKDPVVTVQFLNFKVTVIGEVNRQGALTSPEGKMTLIEAIGQAGDLTFYGRRDNILVIRERNGQREFGRVNLLSKRAFSSPYFVLQQNDVVYVEMTSTKVAVNDQLLVRNVTLASSIISVLSTVIILIINISR